MAQVDLKFCQMEDKDPLIPIVNIKVADDMRSLGFNSQGIELP